MKEIDFLIIYEHKNREFESITLLKHELVRRGYTVEFFSFYEMHNRKKRKRLFDNVKIAVMPSLYHDEEILNFVYGVAGKVKNIVNLRWEQIFSKKTENNLDYYVYPKQNAKKGYHLCWGQRPYEMLKNAGVEDSNLFITGPIQMDFLRNDFNGYYFDKRALFEQYEIDKKKKCILFSSSFVSCSWNKWELEWLFSQFDEEEKETVKRKIEEQVKSREIVVGWLDRLASEKGCTVIYRPHPAEAKTDLIDHLKENENIRVIGDYNIKQWILTCDQVYTWNSTSLIEATVAGIPCAVLRPIKFDVNDEYSIYEEIPYITNYQQIVDYYEGNFANISKQFVDNQKLNSYLSIEPDKPSYMRTADVLELALKDDYYFPWNSFSEDDVYGIRKDRKKQDRNDLLSQIVFKPFYNFHFLKRVLNRIFPSLNHQYAVLVDDAKKVISEEEFQQMEEKIAYVISKNR